MGRSPLEATQPDLCERCRHDPGQLLAGHVELGRSEGHILVDRRAEDLIVRILKQQADLAADVVKRVPRDGLAGDENARLVGKVLGEDPVQVQEERGLPRAVGPHDADTLPFGNSDIDALERRHVLVGEAQAADFDRRRHRHPRAHMAA